jgi:hypothetical protein
MDTVTGGVERHDKNLWVFGNSVFIFNELTKPDPFATIFFPVSFCKIFKINTSDMNGRRMHTMLGE